MHSCGNGREGALYLNQPKNVYFIIAKGSFFMYNGVKTTVYTDINIQD